MDSEDKFWTYLWITLVSGVVALAIVAAVASSYSTRKFVEGGYYECSLPGLQSGRWCK